MPLRSRHLEAIVRSGLQGDSGGVARIVDREGERLLSGQHRRRFGGLAQRLATRLDKERQATQPGQAPEQDTRNQDRHDKASPHVFQPGATLQEPPETPGHARMRPEVGHAPVLQPGPRQPRPRQCGPRSGLLEPEERTEPTGHEPRMPVPAEDLGAPPRSAVEHDRADNRRPLQREVEPASPEDGAEGGRHRPLVKLENPQSRPTRSGPRPPRNRAAARSAHRA